MKISRFNKDFVSNLIGEYIGSLPMTDISEVFVRKVILLCGSFGNESYRDRLALGLRQSGWSVDSVFNMFLSEYTADEIKVIDAVSVEQKYSPQCLRLVGDLAQGVAAIRPHSKIPFEKWIETKTLEEDARWTQAFGYINTERELQNMRDQIKNCDRNDPEQFLKAMINVGKLTNNFGPQETERQLDILGDSDAINVFAAAHSMEAGQDVASMMFATAGADFSNGRINLTAYKKRIATYSVLRFLSEGKPVGGADTLYNVLTNHLIGPELKVISKA
jgi:hypothetical protein